MSILSVREIWSGRQGGEAEKGERTYQRTFRVFTDDTLDGPIQVRTALGIPRVGDPYITATEFDAGSRCQNVEGAQSDDPNVWQVTATYSSKKEDPEKDKDDPLDRAAEIEWSSEKVSRVMDRDLTGKAVVNSAGEKFDPPIEVEESLPLVTITRNEDSYNYSLGLQYQDAVNSDPFFGFDPGQAKIKEIRARSQFENDQYTWKVTYAIVFKREGWQTEVLDQGYWSVNEDGDKVLIKDVDNKPLSAPALLDGNGFEVSVKKITGAAGTPIVITTEGNHGYSVGTQVTISGVAGNTAANGGFTISAATATTFTLQGSASNGPYVSGGNAVNVYYHQFKFTKEMPFAALGLP